MIRTKLLTEDTYYVGVNDRHTQLFENMHSIPYGVSYNSYLILDEKTALIDTMEISFSEIFIEKIQTVLQGRKLDYLVINHMEPDHSGSIKQIRRIFPEIKIVGNIKTFDMVNGFYGISDNLHEVKDGDTLSLGRHTLQFHLTPMVHWVETMMTYDLHTRTLFSGDAFGSFRALDGGVLDTELRVEDFWEEMRRYYSNIVGKYGSPVQKAIGKLAGIPIDLICATHGPVWKEHIAEVIDMYDRMSRYEGEAGVVIAYASMYGNTGQMAEVLAGYLSDYGVRNIVVHNLSRSNASYVISDIFKYKALVLGCPTYNAELYPEMASLLMRIETRGIKNRIYGCFGSYSWVGVAVKQLQAFGEKMAWDTCTPSPEQKQALKPERYAELAALAKEIAGKLNG
ncbi:MAG: FprA family A-type flavoprotein [Prevotellaceae bacterium]|jgi:flavorubredoxin|nr:FprA family A-type flavoprotein [Prevotellaceae bacterium]